MFAIELAVNVAVPDDGNRRQRGKWKSPNRISLTRGSLGDQWWRRERPAAIAIAEEMISVARRNARKGEYLSSTDVAL